jgi:hypothetical protein
MAPSKIESFLFGLALLLVIPYMLFSIRLHAHSVNPDSSSIPTDHLWRMNSLRTHKASEQTQGKFQGGDATKKNAIGSRYSLKPGREAVEAWLREHRNNFPTFVTANIPALFSPSEDEKSEEEKEESVSNKVIAEYTKDALNYDPKFQAMPFVDGKISNSEIRQQHDDHSQSVENNNDKIKIGVVELNSNIEAEPSPVMASIEVEQKPVAVRKNHAIVKRASARERNFVFDTPLDGEWISETKKEISASSMANAQGSSSLTLSSKQQSRCLLFTMDSIDNYIEKSKRGGASGEITIRESLVSHLESVLNVKTDVARSDKEFETLAM